MCLLYLSEIRYIFQLFKYWYITGTVYALKSVLNEEISISLQFGLLPRGRCSVLLA